MFVTHPFDIKGFVAVKSRYKDISRPDDFVTYIPAIRRVRRLSGTDTQDPLVSSDWTWDDWRNWWVKMSSEIWPMEVKMDEETIALSQSGYFPYKLKDNMIVAYWEKRPVWVLDQRMKDLTYLYRRQKIYVDKETYAPLVKIIYDQDENLWKTSWCNFRWYPSGHTLYLFGEIVDMINRHRSHMKAESILHLPLGDEVFSTRFLSREAR